VQAETHTESDVVVTVGRRVPVAVRGAAVPCIVVERAAAQDAGESALPAVFIGSIRRAAEADLKSIYA
jgi:hypothetical protein